MPAERLRVLLFGRYADAEAGGIERHVRSIVTSLPQVGFVNLVEERGKTKDLSWPCPVHYAASIAVVASQPICPGMPWLARRLHREQRFDIAHLHLPDPMSHLAALALPGDVRFVLSWHSDIVRQQSMFWAYRPFLRRLVERAQAVIVPTPVHADSMPQLAALVPPEKRALVPFGFDLAPFETPHPKVAELRRRFGPRVVFALGRHVYYKGFEYLIRAMALVPQAVLVLGGSGPLMQSLEQRAAQAGVAERVVFAGRIPEEDLPAYYQACDVFCLPSVERAEAFGIVQVEAMAAGKPVVCTQLDNGVNWVNPHGVTGLTVAPRDPAALAAALGQLFADEPLRRALGAAGAARAAQNFSLAALAAGTLAVYQRAVRVLR